MRILPVECDRIKQLLDNRCRADDHDHFLSTTLFSPTITIANLHKFSHNYASEYCHILLTTPHVYFSFSTRDSIFCPSRCVLFYSAINLPKALILHAAINHAAKVSAHIRRQNSARSFPNTYRARCAAVIYTPSLEVFL